MARRLLQKLKKHKLKTHHLKALGSWLQGVGRVSVQFLAYYIKRCLKDRVNVIAGHLTYVTLLSLVPMVAVVFSIFAAFPVFESLREQVQEVLLANLIPARTEAISAYLENFVENTHQMTAVGGVSLLVIALLLMSAIDKAMNRIWRVEKPRRLVVSIAIYWMIITLGPVLMSVSLAVGSYFLSSELLSEPGIETVKPVLLQLMPYFSTFVAFLLLYMLVPNRVVRFKHALWGALLAACLFEAAKNIFQLYIHYFPSYQLIYGALATIPILIVWIYLSWNIVLLGAELSVSLEEFKFKETK